MKLIILDRDGVINEDSDNYIKSPEEWIPIPGSLDAIAKLKKAGYTIAVASNQSGIARGLYDESTLQTIHEKMQRCAEEAGGAIDYVVYCPHLPSDHCACRKPAPGLLIQIGEYFSVSLNDVYFIGDKLSDLKAAEKAGCKPVLVKTGYGEQTITELAAYPTLSVPVFNDLLAFANMIS